MPHPASSSGLSRRDFLAAGTLLPALALAPSFARAALTEPFPSRVKSTTKKIPIGLELYAVRTELQRDLINTLTQVARMGYEAVEFYAPYYDWEIPFAKEVRRILDDLRLQCLTTHNQLPSFTPGAGIAKAIELNQILGVQQVILSSAGNEITTSEQWLQLAGRLTRATQELLPHGLTAGFHNHQTEWRRVDGDQRIIDLLAANTPREFVLQLDVGTCLEAGEDPVAWIRKHPGRIRSIHLKDWAPGGETEEKGYRVLFGEGVAPWAEIIATAESIGGTEIFLMEQEGSRFSEFESAQRCLEAWKKLRGQA
jgi:sugar phosphate isomerase/epimerase